MAEYRKIGDCAYSRPGVTTAVIDGALKEYAADVPVFESAGLRVWEQVTNFFSKSESLTHSDLAGPDGQRASLSKTSVSGFFEYTLTLSGGGTVDIPVGSFSGVVSWQLMAKKNSGDAGLTKLKNRAISGIVISNTYFENYIYTEDIGSSLKPNYISFSSTGDIDITFRSAQFNGDRIMLSPYIPTYGSAVTCPKSVCTMPTPELMKSDNWELSVDFHLDAVKSPYSGRVVSCGTFSTGVEVIYDNDLRVYFRIGGVSLSIANAVIIGDNNVIISHLNGLSKINCNGNETSLNTPMPTLGDSLVIGSDSNFLNQVNGNIKNLKVKPHA